MSRVRALIIASHPGPSLAITALATLLAAEAAPHGMGPCLWRRRCWPASSRSAGPTTPSTPAGTPRPAGRTSRSPTGAISARAVWIAAFAALAGRAGDVAGHQRGDRDDPRGDHRRRVGLQPRAEVDAGVGRDVPARIRPDTRVRGEHAAGSPRAAMVGDGGGGPGRASAPTSPTCCPTWPPTGPPASTACHSRWPPGGGPGAVRAIALVLLLSASVLLLLASSPSRRWVALAGLAIAALLAVVGAAGSGRLPFLAAIGIAAVDVVLFAVGVDGADLTRQRDAHRCEVRACLRCRHDQIVAVRSAFPAYRYPQAELDSQVHRPQPACRPGSERCSSGCTGTPASIPATSSLPIAGVRRPARDRARQRALHRGGHRPRRAGAARGPGHGRPGRDAIWTC